MANNLEEHCKLAAKIVASWPKWKRFSLPPVDGTIVERKRDRVNTKVDAGNKKVQRS